MRQQNCGLTALELLITLSLVLVLMIAGFPGLKAYRMNQHIRSASALLYSDLKFARGKAIALNTRTVVCPAGSNEPCSGNSQWHKGWLAFADLNGDRQWQAEEPVLRRINPVDGLTVLSLDSRHQVQFFPGGSAPGSNTSVVFCDQRGLDNGLKIITSNSGRIRQSSLSASDATLCRGS